MTAALGWALVLAAVVAGYAGYGWRGVALAATVVVFWLLLQFSRALRTMRAASGRPVGSIDNAVMLQARLQPGMRLVDVIAITRSLGRRIDGAADETWAWTDGAGDAVQLALRQGRVVDVRLLRASGDAAAPAHTEADGT